MSPRDGYGPYEPDGYWDGYRAGGYGSDATLPYTQRPGGPRPPRGQGPARTGRSARSPRRRRWPVRIFKVLLVVVVLLAIVVGGLFLITPSVSQAPALVQEKAVQQGIRYPGVQPPARFTEALVATEDHRFYSTPGVDPLAVGRLIAGKLTGHPDQGGSTLEQQLAKNLYTPGRSGFTVEAEQVVLAVKLNMSYSKPQILRMYAEIAYYGDDYYGLRAASCGYFGTEPAQPDLAGGRGPGGRGERSHRR